MSMQKNETDSTIQSHNSGYGSSDETATLLVVTSITEPSGATCKASISTHQSTNGPTNKPVLIRQDRTSTYLASPQLSGTNLGGSEESTCIDEEGATSVQHAARSVPDIELHCNLETPIISVCDATSSGTRYPAISYNRCLACRNCDRRASTAPMSSAVQLVGRSASKESVSMHVAGGGRYSPSLPKQQSANIPPVLITSSPTGSRIIRQSSQPEQSSIVCCSAHCSHAHTAPNVSLQRLKDPSDGIAGIAVDSLRINGAMKPFKQVSFFVCELSLRLYTIISWHNVFIF